MTEHDNPDDATENETAAAKSEPPETVKPEPEPEPTKAETASPASKPRASWTGALALVVSLAAAGGAAWLWWQQQMQRESLGRIGGLQDEARQLESRLGGLEDRLERLLETDERLAVDLGTVRESLSSQRLQLDELPLRVGRLERALEDVPGVADNARATWLLSEAEYYLRVGNAQLTLARNPVVALRALELADEKLRDVGDPGLTRVRALLADEITALRAMPDPDAEGIALRLGSLARSLNDLPFARQQPGTFGRDNVADEELTGLERAWAAVKNAFLSLVRVKSTNDDVTPLRTAAEEALLLRSMETELALARLALIRGEGNLFRDALDGVDLALRQYFDTNDTAVVGTLDQIAELRTADLPESLPNISGSLQLLLRTGSGAAAQ
ncbi:MAG: uroporphyrinogen-III C-methyltransferase [Gammaproteobacteria bacterium]|nr:uroporphyrinogen-III C-methyltransferase [Gammaproteobacteria bacterium]